MRLVESDATYGRFRILSNQCGLAQVGCHSYSVGVERATTNSGQDAPPTVGCTSPN